jgi:hypothetical protein
VEKAADTLNVKQVAVAVVVVSLLRNCLLIKNGNQDVMQMNLNWGILLDGIYSSH